MRLTEEEYYQYLEIQFELLYFVGKKSKLIHQNASMDDFKNYPLDKKLAIRDEMYKNIEWLDDYVSENSKRLSDDTKEIIRGFKHYRRSIFYVIKLTNQFAYFLGDKYVYGVYAINQPFHAQLDSKFPSVVQTALLPFKGKIIYDGFLKKHALVFGGEMGRSINNEYRLAEGKYGVITELPEKVSVDNQEDRFERELLVMMKTKSSREYNWYEIENLLEKHPELEPVYIREWGRINSRKKKKELKALGLTKRWFVMHDDTIILSAKSKKELEEQIKDLIPEKIDRDGMYYFKT